MKRWITQEQKWFIKGRYILDSIIALWEGMEYAEKHNKTSLTKPIIEYIGTTSSNPLGT